MTNKAGVESSPETSCTSIAPPLNDSPSFDLRDSSPSVSLGAGVEVDEESRDEGLREGGKRRVAGLNVDRNKLNDIVLI